MKWKFLVIPLLFSSVILGCTMKTPFRQEEESSHDQEDFGSMKLLKSETMNVLHLNGYRYHDGEFVLFSSEVLYMEDPAILITFKMDHDKSAFSFLIYGLHSGVSMETQPVSMMPEGGSFCGSYPESVDLQTVPQRLFSFAMTEPLASYSCQLDRPGPGSYQKEGTFLYFTGYVSSDQNS